MRYLLSTCNVNSREEAALWTGQGDARSVGLLATLFRAGMSMARYGAWGIGGIAALVFLLVAIGVGVMALRGRDDGAPIVEVTVTPPAEAMPSVVAPPTIPPLPTLMPEQVYAIGTRTGVPSVDAVLGAVESGSPTQLAGVLSYFPVPCTVSVGIGAVPCPAGTSFGTSIDVMGVGVCEGEFFREGLDDPTVVLTSFLQGPGPDRESLPAVDPRVFAIIERPIFPTDPTVPGDHLVFASGHLISVDEAGATWLAFGCGSSDPSIFVSGPQAVPGQTFLFSPR
ncbi:hypothetical protein [Pseudorhodoplanes sp.]|uniref:hypothetical protein n=1 Tax=Pseudorhodoplanes sp. TaxID=1934341 RepID=UPI003D0B6FDB